MRYTEGKEERQSETRHYETRWDSEICSKTNRKDARAGQGIFSLCHLPNKRTPRWPLLPHIWQVDIHVYQLLFLFLFLCPFFCLSLCLYLFCFYRCCCCETELLFSIVRPNWKEGDKEWWVTEYEEKMRMRRGKEDNEGKGLWEESRERKGE